MRINTNVSSLNAWRNLSSTDGAMSKNLERLSSGYRINRAADDVAGLAISENMRAQITGLNQAVKNAQDGTSLLQTAEGSLNEVHTMLQRMRELAVQSANGTLQPEDRKQIQTEMDNLSKEVTRITNATQFNSKDLIDGSLQDSAIQSVTLQIGPNGGQTVNFAIGAMDARSLGIARDVLAGNVDNGAMTMGVVAGGAANVATVTALGGGIDSTKLYQVAESGTNLQLQKSSDGGATWTNVGTASATTTLGDAATGETITITAGAGGGPGTVDRLNFSAGGARAVEAIGNVSAGVQAGQYMVKWDASNQTVQLFDVTGNTNIGAAHKVDISNSAPANQTFTLGDPEKGQTIDITVATKALDTVNNRQDIITISSSSGKVVSDGTAGANKTLASVVSSSNFLDNGAYTVKVSGSTIQLFDQNNRAIGAAQTWASNTDITLGDVTTQRTVKVHTATSAAIGGDATIQITNNGQSAETAQFTGHAKYESARAFAGLDVSSANAAAMALDKIDKAIGQVSYQRSQLGAIQNRLDHTINNLQVVSENLTASESRIRDVDMAMEMTQFTKHQILMQSGTAMLAQANQKNQAVLSLLR